jgi:ribosomal protein L7Ae-like RNA K-turn-binding protein
VISRSLSSLLGLCQRAGRLASGELAAEQALRRRRAVLLLVAQDVSERTREKYLQLARSSGTPCFLAGTMEELGLAAGKSRRAALAVQSADFARGIRGLLEKEGYQPVP